MNRTAIEWTDFSANPLKYRDRRTGEVVWACVKKSAGCANCYAEAIAERFGRGGPFTRAMMEHVEPFLDEKELRRMLTATTVGGKAVAGSRVFCSDMTDVFGDWVPDALLDRLFAVFALRPDVTWQVLTKRADRMADYLTHPYRAGAIQDVCRTVFDRTDFGVGYPMSWPLPSVWLGTSVENQAAADDRIPHLLRTPAAVRFLSCEPLLGPVDLSKDETVQYCCACSETTAIDLNVNGGNCANCGDPRTRERSYLDTCMIDWIIVGGESGPGARPMAVEWVRDILRQCRAASVPAFVKQLGARPYVCNSAERFDWPESAGWEVRSEDPADPATVRTWFTLKDKKGGDMADWSEDLRVREFPKGAT